MEVSCRVTREFKIKINKTIIINDKGQDNILLFFSIYLGLKTTYIVGRCLII